MGGALHHGLRQDFKKPYLHFNPGEGATAEEEASLFVGAYAGYSHRPQRDDVLTAARRLHTAGGGRGNWGRAGRCQSNCLR